MSLIMTLMKDILIAAMFYYNAALLDRYDGRIARRLNVSSELGKELDSFGRFNFFWSCSFCVNIQHV